MATTRLETTRSRTATAVLVIIAPALLVMVVSSDMVTVVTPMIGAAFGTSRAGLAWVVTGHLLVFAIGIPFYGKVSDRFSLRRLILVALITFAAGSAINAVAPASFRWSSAG